MSGMISQMSGSGRETLLDVREWWESLPDVREWSGRPPGCPGVVRKPYWLSGRPSRMSRRPSRMSGSGRETLPNAWEWWEALPDVLEWSGGHPGCLEVLGRPSQLSGSC